MLSVPGADMQPGYPHITARFLKSLHVCILQSSCLSPRLLYDTAIPELIPTQLGAQKAWHPLVAQPDLTGQCLLNVLLTPLPGPLGAARSWASI